MGLLSFLLIYCNMYLFWIWGLCKLKISFPIPWHVACVLLDGWHGGSKGLPLWIPLLTPWVPWNLLSLPGLPFSCILEFLAPQPQQPCYPLRRQAAREVSESPWEGQCEPCAGRARVLFSSLPWAEKTEFGSVSRINFYFIHQRRKEWHGKGFRGSQFLKPFVLAWISVYGQW